MTNLVLASGQITNHDEITIALVEPADGTPALVRVHWPLRPTTAAATIILLWRRRSSGSSPRAQRRWHDTRREDCEQRPQGVPTVRGRPPGSHGGRAVGVVDGPGWADLAGLKCFRGRMTE